MSNLQLKLAGEYQHIETGVVYILTMADIEEEWVELYKGTVKELNDNNFREVWAGTIDAFNKQWRVK